MPSKKELEFSYKAIELQMITADHLKQCIQLQKQWSNQNQRYFPLPQIMLYTKYLNPEQVELIKKHLQTATICTDESQDSFAQEYESFEKENGDLSVQEYVEDFQEHQENIVSYQFNGNIKNLGRFTIVKEIGAGGMGVVYRAYDPRLERNVAIKVLRCEEHATETEITRFMQEAKATAKLQHPNIVSVHETDCEENQFFFVMDLIEGTSLKQYLQSEKTSLLQIANMMIKLCKAISYAHKKGMIHRDLKPSNIMLDKEQEPKIMDFGLVKMLEGSFKSFSQTGTVLGTYQYMAPEQAEGAKEIDKRTDIYALGVILYEMLTQKLPFKSNSHVGILFQLEQFDLIPPIRIDHRIPEEISNICIKAMAKNKENRYSRADEFIKALDDFKNNYFTQSTPSFSSPPPKYKNMNTLKRTIEVIVGEKFAKFYLVEKELSKDVLSSQYKVYDEEIFRHSVLKIISAKNTKKINDKFFQEVKANMALEHPGIEKIYKFNDVPFRYLITEYIEGKILSEAIKEKSVSIQETIKIFKQCCETMYFAHSKNILHGNINSNNIVLHGDIAKITNFGFTKTMEEVIKRAKPDKLLEHLPYISPELSMGKKIDFRSDIYSLGVVLYQMLTFKLPFIENNPIHLIKAISTKEPLEPGKINSLISKELEIVCLKCLSKKPEKRYQNLEDLIKELDRSYNKIVSLKKYQTLNTIILKASVVFLTGLLFFSLYYFHKKMENAKAQYKTSQKVAFSIDNKKLLFSEQQDLVLYDIAQKKEIMKFKGHTNTILCCAFSPDGQKIASGGKDGTVRIWKATHRKAIAIKKLSAWVLSCKFSLDNRKIIIVCAGKQPEVWKLDSKD